MAYIVADNLIEYRVAILKSSCMHWHDKHTRLEDARIVNKQAVGLSNAGYDNIGILEEFFCVVCYREIESL